MRLRRARTYLLFLSVLALGIAGSWSTALAATDPGLGTASSFAVLGGSAVTNTGPSVLNGNLGVWPGTSVTGYPPLVLNGALHQSDAVAAQAQLDLTTAYNSAAGQPVTQDLTGQDLGNKLLTPGVYHFSSSAQLTGPLTLDGQGATHAVFIFQIGSTLTTASAASVSLVNGASECDVWWQIGSSATLGTATTFRGNLMALTSITLNTGANIPGGRALARNGAVTLDTNVISLPTGCGSSSSGNSSGTPSSSPSLGSPAGPDTGTSLSQPPGSTPSVGGPTAGSPGTPSASPSPRIPVTAAPPDVSTPNTGRGLLLGHFIVGAGLILFGVVMFATAGRRYRKSR
ncbi:MAG: ice-binding family protein [Candidatus Dormiibacterota bacterium]